MIREFIHNKIGHLKAFTLLETLTSIAILSFVIIGPLTVIMGSSSYARQTKDVMVATYLLEESVELLQNQYDTLYIYCKNQPSDPFCATSTGEVGGQIPWRLFKERLGAIGGYPSCYSASNPGGCSFDYLDMAGGATTTPSRYLVSGVECPFLVGVTTPIVGGDGENLYTYACSGIPAHINGSVSIMNFARSVFVEQIPTFEGSLPQDQQYNDDLRITSQIKFKGVNGVTQTQKIVRFFHARP